MGDVWKLIQQHQEATPYGASIREIARAAGVRESTLPRWQNLRRLPEPEHLRAVARQINVPYRVLLEAALTDTGYLEVRASAKDVRDHADPAPTNPAGGSPASDELARLRRRQEEADAAPVSEILGAAAEKDEGEG